MKTAFLSLLVILASVSAEARPRGYDPRPYERPGVCVVNLEIESYNSRRGWTFDFVESFTDFGARACSMAEEACERVKARKWDYWNYRCEKDFSNRGGNPQAGMTCAYKIETRQGLEPEVYNARGRDACGFAQSDCERDLIRKQNLGLRNRHLGGVGPAARCVNIGGNDSRPSGPRVFTAVCTVGRDMGRRGVRDGVVFTETVTAPTYQTAREVACVKAMRTCENASMRGNRPCRILD
ncbi:MAG: hypothetical protein K9K67_08880 [Bacteriovoracaceae bacterium]|nr:hypothetical protein [Bacteriovoracaceae bacterium]